MIRFTCLEDSSDFLVEDNGRRAKSRRRKISSEATGLVQKRDGGKKWSELENISINPASLTLLQGVKVWESFRKKKHILMPSLPYHRTTSYALPDCTA